MRRPIIVTALALAAAALACNALAWGPYSYSDAQGASNLTIWRTANGSLWDWSYKLDHVTGPNITLFSAGIIVPGASHYTSLSPGGLYQTSHLTWSGFTVPAGGSKTFTFTTDLPDVTQANHQARDNIYTADWKLKETPGVIPEATTIMLGAIGLSTIVGFRWVRRK